MLVHIGYHKTATTWLQQHLFVPDAGFMPVASRMELKTHVIFAEPFDPMLVRNLMQPRLEEARRRDLLPVISYERLSGDPYPYGERDGALIADRLARIAPEAHILITIREQVSALVSLYVQYIRSSHGTLPLRRFLQMPGQLDHLAYTALVTRYVDLFGPQQVLVLPFEHFRADGPAFAARIVEHAGGSGLPADLPFARRELAALTPTAAAARRVVNGLFAQRGRHNPRALLPSQTLYRLAGGIIRRLPETRLNAALKNRWRALTVQIAGERYKADNAHLAALTGLPLGAYGYALLTDRQREVDTSALLYPH
ncbi:MAG: hypothetical protein GYB64_15785 [Chloroflexi bacterium]|nr:hypothetical protein [Chloroflexota bacterium]